MGLQYRCLLPDLFDHWLQLRPGSEAALAMGFLNVVITENLYDREFIKKWANAPHLIREDTNKVLRESHLIKDGSEVNFVVWDETAKATAVSMQPANLRQSSGARPSTSLPMSRPRPRPM